MKTDANTKGREIESMTNWEKQVAEMSLNESKLEIAIEAYKVTCDGKRNADNAVWIAYTDACEVLNEHEKIELNRRLDALP